ncbi:unnamed protein product [Amoebophrya sp. A25]|nr:unnamed protein product [Amoebophrya sp. A25]|eukprot:GSA25T00005675001.1
MLDGFSSFFGSSWFITIIAVWISVSALGMLSLTSSAKNLGFLWHIRGVVLALVEPFLDFLLTQIGLPPIWFDSVPAAVGRMKAIAVSETEVRVTFEAGTSVEEVGPLHRERYLVQMRDIGRRTGTKSPWRRITILEWDEDRFLTVGELRPGSRTEYRVCAFNSTGTGNWGRIASAMTFYQMNHQSGGDGPPCNVAPAKLTEEAPADTLGDSADDIALAQLVERENSEVSSLPPLYTWGQTAEALTLNVRVGSAVRAKGVTVRLKPTELSITADDNPILHGPLFSFAVPDELTWTLEDGNLSVEFAKRTAKEKWPCIIKDHPRIDPRNVTFGNNSLSVGAREQLRTLGLD